MSLESWKEEFYKVPASEVSAADAVAHSILKWEGLREENLDKHNCCRVGSTIQESTRRGGILSKIGVDGTSCALCTSYLDNDYDEECSDCPLFQVRGGVRCDNRTEQEQECDQSEPYQHFGHTGDPEPMIFWLKACQSVAQ